MKAKYVGKYVDTSYGAFIVHLEYEYRGKRYEVVEDRCKGNLPIAWQHRNEQIAIDAQIEREEKPKPTAEPFDFAEIYALMGWD